MKVKLPFNQSHDLWLLITIAVMIGGAGSGILYAVMAGHDDAVLAVGSQSDGRAILAGKFEPNRIVRRNLDGTLDSSFCKNVTVGGFNATIKSLVIQKDDHIVVGGEFSTFDESLAGYIARLDANGNLDTSFASKAGTGFDDVVNHIELQEDGKILVGGQFKSYNGVSLNHLARLNSDGNLDKTFFNPSPEDVTSPVLAVNQAPNGDILVGTETELVGFGP